VGVLVFLSLLILGGAFAASWWARREVSKSQAVSLAAEVPLSQLIEDAGSVAKEMGAGSFRQEVKIRGTISCDSPLVAELSHTACVSYRFSVTREYEEVLWEVNPKGGSHQHLHRKSEVVASNQAEVAFWLDDGTAKILVHPEKARIERIKSHASFQQATAGFGVNVGSFVLNLRSHPGGTLGYRYEEYCLPVGHEVTVIAEAGDVGGQLALRRPEDGDAPFLVSPQSFTELAKGNQWLPPVLRGVSIGLAAVAVLIFLLGVLR